MLRVEYARIRQHRKKAVMIDDNNSREIVQKIEELEGKLEELSAVIRERRTILSNAHKKLQQFQDSMYAVLMEEEHPSRKVRHTQNDSPDETP